MRKVSVVNAIIIGLFTVCAGCQTSEKGTSTGDQARRPGSKAARASGVSDNPTTRAGRGTPDLDAFDRPAAWIYIDGQEGRFTEKDGHPWVQWIIDTPVSPTPTFRAEVYKPLLGSPKDFQCVLQTREAPGGTSIQYAIKAKPGTFEVGKEYSLIEPGDNFIIRDAKTGELADEIAPLAPGTYGLSAGIKNAAKEAEGLAVTYFTVGEPEPVATDTGSEE